MVARPDASLGRRSGAFGIYVHWPFCAAKCPYCDFNSHVRTRIDEAGWVTGIEQELDWVAQRQGDARPVVETIFFGGGTPSLMAGKSVGRILEKIARLWPHANDVEVTLEANPASADAAVTEKSAPLIPCGISIPHPFLSGSRPGPDARARAGKRKGARTGSKRLDKPPVKS